MGSFLEHAINAVALALKASERAKAAKQAEADARREARGGRPARPGSRRPLGGGFEGSDPDDCCIANRRRIKR